MTAQSSRAERSWLGHLWRILARNRLTFLGLIVLLIIATASALAPVVAPYSFEQMSLQERLAPPGAQHLFGTDNFGRDIFSRVLYGGQSSLLVSLAAVSGALTVGTFLGGIAAYYGGWLDETIMRLMDIILAFPYIVLAITLVVVLSPGLATVVIVIVVIQLPAFTRVTRGSVLVIMNQEFILAARATGQRDIWILLRHVLPNAITPLVVMASLSLGTAITAEAALSFLGLGVQPPMSSWGTMIYEGTRALTTAPWTTAFPGLALSLTILGVNLVGDGMRDALDPRLRRI
ncbi:MAG: ABC transporter permease [Ardenticatenaceae bacterium]|nr:ABC transporter permease [Ardenticatenaceae bacterium]